MNQYDLVHLFVLHYCTCFIYVNINGFSIDLTCYKLEYIKMKVRCNMLHLVVDA